MKKGSRVIGRWALSFLGILIATGSLYAATQTPSLLNKQAPLFVRVDLDGRRIDLSAFRGKLVLLNFWATWCAPCRVELSRFANWQRHYEPKGLQVIAVSMDDETAPVRTTVDRLRLNFPIVMGDEEIGLQYGGVLGLPVTYLIGPDGTIRAQFKGETNLRVMEKRVKKLLGKH